MIKILHIISSLTIDSGVASFVMNYYRNIDRNKVQFDFLYFVKSDEKLLNEIKRLGGNVYFVNKPSLKHILKTYWEFDKFLKNNACKYIAVHLHEVYLVHFIKSFCKKYGIKHLITHAHTTKYSDNPKNALRNKIMCLGLNHAATNYFACSKAAGEFYYGKRAVKKGLVKVIPNAIDLKKYKFSQDVREKVRKTLNIDDKFVVGHIGRMVPQKNQKFLLKIFAKVRKENGKAVLLIIGDGPLRNDLENEITRLKLKDSVILLGVRNDVPELLMAMDVFVLPSLFEGLGIVAIEAQATGLKCILSDEIPKEVDCGNCEFVSLNTYIRSWSTCILKNDKSLSNYKLLDLYSIELASKKLESIYLNLL